MVKKGGLVDKYNKNYTHTGHYKIMLVDRSIDAQRVYIAIIRKFPSC